MNPEQLLWKFGLLFALVGALLGMIGFVSLRRVAERSLVNGQFLQGVLLIFVVAGANFRGSTALDLGGLVVVGLLIIQTFLVPKSDADGNVRGEEPAP